MRKLTIGFIFASGLLVGMFAPRLVEREALAQGNWQCRSWTLDSGDTVGAVSNFLSGAQAVQLTSTGLSVANRVWLVACKQ